MVKNRSTRIAAVISELSYELRNHYGFSYAEAEKNAQAFVDRKEAEWIVVEKSLGKVGGSGHSSPSLKRKLKSSEQLFGELNRKHWLEGHESQKKEGSQKKD